MPDARDAARVERLRRGGSAFAEDELAELRRAAGDAAAGGDAIDGDAALDALVARRAAGEPIEAIVSSAAFAELRILVHPGVFVPRRRTTLLAGLVADALRGRGPGARLLDLGCGTGAIAALAAHRAPGTRVTAIDADARAVANARANLPGALVLQAADLAALPADARFDAVAANLPYVPTAELAHLPRDARDHEPALALDGGADGLAPLRALAPQIAARLVPGGVVVTEVAPPQVAAASRILVAAGLEDAVVHEDDAIGATALLARRG
ncbi:methyltransferase [Agrococcus terreus]|uniref:N5-glutamine methyltransferase family protein n=1 Tax=Agrococcus terreus TaxID=574649 RepID=UPI003850DA53